jgi:hypothetical protein
MREPGRQPAAAGAASGPALLVILAVALLGPAAAAAIWPGPCGDAMRDGAGLPVGLVPAAARARGVTDEGLALVRGVGTGHADCRNSSRVTQGSPRRLSPPRLAPGGLPPICYGTRGGPGRFTSPPGMAPGRRWRRCPRRTRRAGADGPFWPSDRTRRGAAGGPRRGERGDLARAASSRLRRHRHMTRRHRPHCQPTRRRLRSSLPHQEQVNEFGPTGLQPVPTRPAGWTDQGRPFGH